VALMVLHLIFSLSVVVQKYYSLVAACRCKEQEIKHICRYHGQQMGKRVLESSQEEIAKQYLNFLLPPKATQASKDIYIEVSPGTYSVTATSEDTVQQTHVVDVSAGQSIDLTFVL
ncbi:AKIP1 protein, partial [Rhinopomastus cyanomelas]|nr:AKIP1 protein [Rhinopomastus cyanomelas]